MKLSYETIRSLTHGASYTERNDNKIIFSRFSKHERSVLTYGQDNSFSTAGIRLEFKTDSRLLKIAVCTAESNPHGRSFYSFDIYSNGNMIGQIKNFNKSPQYPYKKYSLSDKEKIFKLPVGLKRICIYFPWSVQGMIKEIELDDNATVISVTKHKKIIMYGDSITQGYDAGSTSLSYASRLTDLLNAEVINKGIGGSVFMPELSNVKPTFTPDLITVAYGTNEWRGSSFESFNIRCKAFFENLILNYPNTSILAIAPIWRADSAEKHELGDFSKVADTIYKISAQHTDIHFIDGINFIPKDMAYYRDSYLHPNDKGFDFYIKSLSTELRNDICKTNIITPFQPSF